MIALRDGAQSERPTFDSILKVVVAKADGYYTADVPMWPGSPYVGRGTSPVVALGNWLVQNQSVLGITLEFPGADPQPVTQSEPVAPTDPSEKDQ